MAVNFCSFDLFVCLFIQEKQNKMSLQNVSIVLSPTMQISHRVLNVFFGCSKILFKDTVIKKYVSIQVRTIEGSLRTHAVANKLKRSGTTLQSVCLDPDRSLSSTILVSRESARIVN